MTKASGGEHVKGFSPDVFSYFPLMKKLFFLLWSLCSSAMLLAQSPQNIPLCGLGPGAEKHVAGVYQQRIFKGKLFCSLDAIPVGEKHNWILYLENEQGFPMMSEARIEADGINYPAGRGFSTPPAISRFIGNGHYFVDDVLFSVPGTWTLRFQVIYRDKVDVLSFEVVVP
ncbi:MAG: hypothetical protein EAZ89_00780 [Bacteroidetes bacterium]|jgi:hypothetical protein|nr:MAG: hypothetical protein EAZ89_00780 [Bacteroidota bacterium]